MSLVNWSNDLSTSIPQMDAEHKKLINMINRLHDAMKQGHGKDVVSGVLNEMVLYTRTHFTNEERIMAEIDYEGLDAHAAIHNEFVRKVGEFKDSFESGKTAITLEVMTFLSDWLVEHIRGEDKKYGAVHAATT